MNPYSNIPGKQNIFFFKIHILFQKDSWNSKWKIWKKMMMKKKKKMKLEMISNKEKVEIDEKQSPFYAHKDFFDGKRI